MMPRPYSAIEVSEAIGISLDTLYRSRQARHDRDQLPRPISETGRLKWERTGFDAWLTRFHPMRPPAPMNDPLPPPEAFRDDEHRQRLARAYAPQLPPKSLDSAGKSARG